MEKLETISVTLQPNVAAQIQQAVNDGEYRSASEAIEDALRHWGQERELGESGLNYLQSMWQQAQEDSRAGLEAAPVFDRLKDRFATTSKVVSR